MKTELNTGGASTVATARPETPQPWALMNEAAGEALGVLEVLHDSGDLPAYAKDIAAAVIEKYRRAKLAEQREKA